jgi:micrococcal nuclease
VRQGPAKSFLWVRLMMRLWFLALLLALLTPSPATAISEYHGLVVLVLDGDTSKSSTPNTLNASASAGSTALRRASRTAVKPRRQRPRWCLGKKASSRRSAAAGLGVPFLADVRLPDGTHVNHTLVKNGWCWWYRKFAPRNTELARLEQHARKTTQGLWEGPTHIPPWQWRKRTR